MATDPSKSTTLPTTQDSGYLSTTFDSAHDLEPVEPVEPLPHPTTPHHNHTPSSTSSGYYSRLDSSDLDHIPEELQPKPALPWQHYVTPSPDGYTPLHKLVLSSSPTALAHALSLLPHPSVLNVPTEHSQQTPLHLAVLTNQPALVRMLVVGGAGVGVTDGNGDSPVHVACRWGFAECLENMVRALEPEERGVQQIGGCDLEARNWEGLAPIHLATLSHPSTPPSTPSPPPLTCLHLLLFSSTSPSPTSLPEGKAGRTPLHLAIEKRDLAALSLLLAYSSRVAVETENYAGLTPYTLASCNGLVEFCDVLVRVGGAEGVDYFSEGSEESEGEEF